MNPHPTLLGGALLLLTALAVPAQDRTSPLESGDVRELVVQCPPGTRIDYFRLDLPSPPGSGEEERDPSPVGVVRWISGPDLEAERPVGLRLETTTTFFDVNTRVIHTEHLRNDERKLVYREVRERGGRTVLLEWNPADELRISETVGTGTRRRRIDSGRGVLLPLYLVDLVRSGASIQGPFDVFGPLAGDVETLELEVRELAATTGDAGPTAAAQQELVLRREGKLLAGSFVFSDGRLVRFRWQEGGPEATGITAEEYHGWIRRHRADADH